MKKEKAFTLIELLAVLVVLAILSLIAIPVVIGIIKNARENSYKRSIESYGRAIESAIGMYLTSNSGVDYKNITLDMIENDIKTTGYNVTCNNLSFEKNGNLILRGCTVLNSKTYKYKNKKAIIQKDNYEIGDEITVNGIDFYVINNSTKDDDYVTALKAEPLTVSEVNTYGVVNGINYVNKYTSDSAGTAAVWNGYDYGYLAYYTAEGCGKVDGVWTGEDECKTSYNESDIKPVVDNWAQLNFHEDDLKSIKLQYTNDSYKVRLIDVTDIVKLGFHGDNCHESPYNWIYSNKYSYWTMWAGGKKTMYVINSDGNYYFNNNVCQHYGTIRPVINVYKNKID